MYTWPCNVALCALARCSSDELMTTYRFHGILYMTHLKDF